MTVSRQSVYDLALNEYGTLDGVDWIIEDNPDLNLKDKVPYGYRLRIRKEQALTKEAQATLNHYIENDINIAIADETNPADPGGGGGGGGTICLPAKVYLSDGATLVATILPNGSLSLPKHSIFYQDTTLAATKEFNEDFTMPNVLIKDGGGVTIEEIKPGGIFSLLNWILKDEDGNTLNTGVVTNPGNQEIVAPNGDITVNSAPFDEVLSGGTKDVPVQYINGTPVGTIDSGIVKIPNPINELILKIHYETGDDISEITIDPDTAGTIDAITTTLTSVVIKVNTVVETLPITLVATDEVEITYDPAGSDGSIKLEGEY